MRLATALVLGGAFALGLVACEARVSLGGRCIYDSECTGLRCLYGRCRAECLTSVDCGGALECNAGVCAQPDESCSEADPCLSPDQACAGSICATRCTERACAGDARCDEELPIPVCVPRLPFDAGTADSPAGDEAGTPDAGSADAPRPDAYFTPGGIRDLCVSRYHACVAHGDDGIVHCWGLGGSGELGGGAPLVEGAPGVVPCTVPGIPPNLCSRDLVTVVRGDGTPLLEVVELQCGERTTLARTADGMLYSWGLASNGELGRTHPGETAADAYARPVTDRAGVPLTDVEHASMGLRHGCALRRDGTTWCWGGFAGEPQGQHGTGATDPADEDGAVLATELADALDVSEADTSTCMVRSTGAVACVGLNEAGAAGESSSTTVAVRSARAVTGIASGASQLVSGPQYHCALVDNVPHCWGQAGEGSLGRGDVGDYATRCPDGSSLCDENAEPVLGALTFTEIASGPQANTVCGLSGGRVHCWGGSMYGESGSAERLLAPGGPVELADGGILSDVRLVRVGGFSACALTTSDELYCWGQNAFVHLRTDMPDLGPHAQAVRVRLD